MVASRGEVGGSATELRGGEGLAEMAEARLPLRARKEATKMKKWGSGWERASAASDKGGLGLALPRGAGRRRRAASRWLHAAALSWQRSATEDSGSADSDTAKDA